MKKDKRIDLDIDVKKQKILIRADPIYTSQNIIIFADNHQIFTGSLSRNSEISLSLTHKEAKKLVKELNNNKDIFAKLKPP
ncbi:MAG: hypothetical protein ACFFCI_12980 [Promethearchaeota archaeon]